MTLPRPRYLFVIAVACLAIVVAGVAPLVLGGSSAKDRIASDPEPTLFPDATVARVDALVEPESARSAALMQQWWKAHGSSTDDAAFEAWVAQVFPAPPADRQKEIAEVERLDRSRTPRGVAAASWLEVHGKKDVWKLLVHDQAEWLPAKQGEDRKAAEKAALKIAKTLADSLGAHFGVPAPYVLEPALRPDHKIVPGQTCPCSYPSRHASAAAASRTLLAYLQPHALGQLRWWEDEIDYSRLYMAGHVSSDLEGGALLGDLVGDYILVTRLGVPVADLRPGAGPAAGAPGA
ncbi:hypothetical protein [Nocardioides jiangxiensis]|uniref:PAP2 superfamily protein n=1 Tax=Nocardioides jiangxiensis TaxID=3064524 RepID=A0ABT9B2E4_9ACTN|nr:hypothetical protein [Nocardioides sp. WY-20]MDO7869015.1 hypothetical protein [Nocardioides sp. WY-20]